MITALIIPITIVAIAGIVGYLLYRFVLYDFICNRSVNGTLREFNIKKTQFQIIKEFHANMGEEISEKEILQLQRQYRQHKPEEFLTMYDYIREKSKTDKKE